MQQATTKPKCPLQKRARKQRKKETNQATTLTTTLKNVLIVKRTRRNTQSLTLRKQAFEKRIRNSRSIIYEVKSFEGIRYGHIVHSLNNIHEEKTPTV